MATERHVAQVHQSAWDTDNKTWWSRRSKLEKKLLISLIISVVLAVGFILYFTVKRTGVAIKTDSCSTAGCLLASSQIITHIDPDVDPCDDFFKFACGKFIEQTHGDLKAASVQELEDQVKRQLEEILKEPISDDDHYLVRSQKKIFQSCMNESAVEEESLVIVKETLKELNGWPVVVGYKWKERLFDWTEMVYKLKRRGYPYDMLLAPDVMRDVEDKTHRIVQINEPYVLDIKKQHRELYKKYMSDVAIMFGAEPNRATIEMEKVLDFMDRLNKVSEKNTWNVDNNETEYNYTAERLSRRFKVQDFQDYNNEMDWLDFINAFLYPVANISSNDYVIFPKPEFMEAYFNLMYKTPKRIQANYIIWTVLQTLAPFLSKEIKQLEGNYTCMTKEPLYSSKDRVDFCTSMLSMSYFSSPRNVVYARRYLPTEKREKVKELLDSIKTEFITLLEDSSWMDEESKERALKKAENLHEIIGLPGDYYDDEVLEKFDHVRSVENDVKNTSFLVMVLNRFKIFNDFTFSRINQVAGNDTDQEVLYHHLTTSVNAMYSPQDNALFLPAAVLQGIFYNPDRPMYLNYGAIGSIIGHELTHGFCKDGSEYDEDGNAGNMWTEETEKKFNEVTQCIIQDAEDFDVEDTEKKINGTLTLEENIADYTGVRVSYAAYRKWVAENGEESELPGIEYTPNQLFWISAISYECYKLSGDKLEKGLKYATHAHNAFRATAPMRNNEDFANDFRCPVDSKMNPSEKCQIF